MGAAEVRGCYKGIGLCGPKEDALEIWKCCGDVTMLLRCRGCRIGVEYAAKVWEGGIVEVWRVLQGCGFGEGGP